MLYLERIGCFANFTLERLPVQRDEILIPLGLHLGALPRSQTIKMYKSHSPCTLAGRNERVVVTLFIGPAEATMVAFFGLYILGLYDFIKGLFHLSRCAINSWDEEIFDSEFHSP